jgi:hypothetical protein
MKVYSPPSRKLTHTKNPVWIKSAVKLGTRPFIQSFRGTPKNLAVATKFLAAFVPNVLFCYGELSSIFALHPVDQNIKENTKLCANGYSIGPLSTPSTHAAYHCSKT